MVIGIISDAKFLYSDLYENLETDYSTILISERHKEI